MVLNRGWRRSGRALSLAGAAIWCALGSSGVAQELDAPALTVDQDVPGYQPTGINVGALRLFPSADVRLAYDSNIYAKSTDRQNDAIVTFSPQLVADYDHGNLHAVGTASANIRRFATYTTENSTGALVNGHASLDLGATDQLIGDLGWRRVVEDRGDPEARTDDTVGPRLSNAWNGALDYRHQGTRIGFQAHGAIDRFDYLAPIDADRDLTQYSASGRLSYRIRGQTSVFGEIFANRRNFRLATDFSGIDRDADTIGGRAGISIDPGGLWSGDVGLGVFHFNPDDPTLRSRTGLSARASLMFAPTPRLAFTLEGFRGDVATVRNGASTRVDTRVQLGAQQEVRHNLHWRGAIVYRRSSFIGGSAQRTLGGEGEIEYRLNNRVAIAATAQYADRNSRLASERFERFRGGLELRLRY
ncbi:MAG: outer membrane beta-barrel protein [Sphingomonas sp.]